MEKFRKAAIISIFLMGLDHNILLAQDELINAYSDAAQVINIGGYDDCGQFKEVSIPSYEFQVFTNGGDPLSQVPVEVYALVAEGGYTYYGRVVRSVPIPVQYNAIRQAFVTKQQTLKMASRWKGRNLFCRDRLNEIVFVAKAVGSKREGRLMDYWGGMFRVDLSEKHLRFGRI